MRVGWAWHYLDRGVDSNGDTLEFLLRATRDRNAAIAFFRKTVGASHTTPSRVVNVDKNPAYPIAFEAITHEGFFRPRSSLRQCKYLNNVIEQGHRFIKLRTRLMLGFKRFTTAWRTVRGIEIMQALRKGQARWMAKGDVVGQTRPDLQGVRIGRVARSTQRTLARDPKRCNRTAPAAWEGPVFVEISAGPVNLGQQATSSLRRSVRMNFITLDEKCPLIQIRIPF